MTIPLNKKLLCPSCTRSLSEAFDCASCGTSHSTGDGIFDLRPADIRGRNDEQDWEKHWSKEFQESSSQRFFSFYRKAIFARTVRHFLDGSFPKSRFFVEAGAGTSETSMLVSKHGGERVLAALDLIPAVWRQSHPVMDVRGDIFRLRWPTAPSMASGAWA